MKKVSIGSWAYTMGTFADNPIHLPELCVDLSKLGFDGISMGGFKPHAHPSLYDTPQKKAELKKLLADNNLEVADYAADLWSVDSFKQNKEWLSLFDQSIRFMVDMGFKMIRIDSGTQPILPAGWKYEDAKDFVKVQFKKCAKRAAEDGIEVVWEFEPGFIINEPKNVLEVANDVAEKNFKILFDTCHGYMSSTIGARHIEQGCKLPGGIVEFIGMLKDKIGMVHVIDSDGTLNDKGTSTHNPFGTGYLNFDEIIPAFLKANYTTNWWAIDLCEWPDAWKATADCKDFVDKFNKKYCG